MPGLASLDHRSGLSVETPLGIIDAMVLVFNVVGLVMLMVGALIGSAIAHGIHVSNIHIISLFSAPVVVLVDLAYRRMRKASLFGRGGGSLFFLPVWGWGVLFAVTAIVELARGH